MKRDLQVTVLAGAVLYGLVCLAGTLSLWIVGFFFVSSFFAFIYMMMNSGWRGIGTMLLAMIPVIGALLALDRMMRKAWRQVLAGWFFYAYPLFTAFAPTGYRVGGAFLGAFLWWAFFSFAKSVRLNPSKSFLMMWALPTTTFFMIAAVVVPFVGAFADIDVDSPDEGFDYANGLSDDMTASSLDGSSTYGAWSQFGESADTLSGFSGAGDGTIGETGLLFESVLRSDSDIDLATSSMTESGTGPGGSQDVNLQESMVSRIEEIRLDPVTGVQHIQTSDGTISLDYSEVSGRLTGNSPNGTPLEIWTDQVTGEVHISNDNQTTSFRHDPTTDSWLSVSQSGTTRVDTDPITGEMRVHSPEGVVKFRVDPFSNRIIPS